MSAKKEINKVIITDCGSTTTKAILFEKINGSWKLKARGEAPTTVEKPISDVTLGVLNSFLELEKNADEKLVAESAINKGLKALPLIIRNSKEDVSKEDIKEDRDIKKDKKEKDKEDNEKDTKEDVREDIREDAKENIREDKVKKVDENNIGVDAFLSTSSAGGGLQMLVSGLVKSISAKSAEKAALGAGAIVLDVLSEDDLLEDYESVSKIKKLNPDIFLLAGGFDKGDKKNVIEKAELLLSASPSPRFGNTLKLPVIFAGNKDASNEIKKILSEKFSLQIIENVRPNIDNENLKEAKEAIHNIFLSHVMSHSPGYDKLLSWVSIPIMPTPLAVSEMIESYGQKNNIGILCVDIGGATTDVFSVVKGEASESPKFTRTVSANLGMSYSIGNVLLEAGIENVKRWLDFDIDCDELKDILKNKMLRPTTLPQTINDLKIEQAVAREALRLSFAHHKSFGVEIKNFNKSFGIANIFSQKSSKSFIDIKNIDLIIGSGGVLSHSPNRLDSAIIMLDAFKPVGIVEMAVDSIFMLPHLGVLSKLNKEASFSIFENDCLVRICHVIAPKYNIKKTKNDVLAKVYADNELLGEIRKGEIVNVALTSKKKYRLMLLPLEKSVDFGNGKNKILKKEIVANDFGLLLDGRGRS
ncbi:MAG: glutamate mutase L [Bdellovibrionota bacterium]